MLLRGRRCFRDELSQVPWELFLSRAVYCYSKLTKIISK